MAVPILNWAMMFWHCSRYQVSVMGQSYAAGGRSLSIEMIVGDALDPSTTAQRASDGLARNPIALMKMASLSLMVHNIDIIRCRLPSSFEATSIWMIGVCRQQLPASSFRGSVYRSLRSGIAIFSTKLVIRCHTVTSVQNLRSSALLSRVFCVRNVCELLYTGCYWKGLDDRGNLVIAS